MTTLLLSLLFLMCGTLSGARKNVLLLIADDMRPEIYAYENRDHSFYPNMYTPNLDALAAKSLVMKKAYVQLAVCAPSRVSIFTSRRPDTTFSYGYSTYWRDASGNFTTLPQYFKENGYETASIGKVFHPGKSSGNDDPISWTLPVLRGTSNFESSSKSWEAIEDTRLVDTPLIDWQVANLTMGRLEEVAQKASSGEKPFFIAAGFYKPHLPFVFPESMLQHYPESSIDLPNNKYVPRNMPNRAWQSNYELRKYDDMNSYSGNFNTTLSDDDIKSLRRAYLASITWVDSQIGRVLDKLGELELSDDTIVAFISDHGYLLGEHGQWTKTSEFELAVRTPMMLHIPKLTNCGIETETITELVDLFPTIVSSAGLQPIEKCGANSRNTILCTEGTSLLPLIASPRTPVKSAAFSQMPRTYYNQMGYTIRTERYRYTEWVNFDYGSNVPDWNTPNMQRELYDHKTDWEENFNIVGENAGIADDLRLQLRAGWKDALASQTCRK